MNFLSTNYLFLIVKTNSLRGGRKKALAINFQLMILFLGLRSILAHCTYNIAHNIIVFLKNRGKNLLFLCDFGTRHLFKNQLAKLQSGKKLFFLKSYKNKYKILIQL